MEPEIFQMPPRNSEFADDQYRNRFSWGALVYGPVYYWSVKDWPFFWVSLIATFSLYGTPLLIPLAFFARRRAWETKEWVDGESFRRAQQSWDRSGIIMGILGLISLYFVWQFIGNTLSSSGINTQSLPQSQQQIQDILGN